ncbi:hypothetical protein [Pseudaquabacterium pictum]|uniref:Uncharacterized protein n=1 Tax=Pseudaquabacterium pictum TaxID=2315236 RepID=A0A480AMK2_9BURK|nr:hypothetical protein [Rubrivivax pictus]GCL62593.1 hypothetical protein AQPW35_16740 [Rubrivivax pictus]
MADATATILGALIGFLGGLIVARYTFRQKADELFLSGLQYLAGGSQQRNLGIAALRLAWESKRHQKHIAPLVVGSAIYLLQESKQEDAAHEVNNLQRLMKLVFDAKREGALTDEDRASVVTAIEAKLKIGPRNSPGLFVKEEDLKTWQKHFGGDA